MATTCAYCGLPVPAPLFAWRAAAGDGDDYCCYGCRFAAAVAGAGGEQGRQAWNLARLSLAVFLSLNVMAFTMALWTQDVYESEPGALAGPIYGLFRYLCMFFALPVLLLLGGPLWENAWANLRRGQASMDLLLLLGVAAAYLQSTISVLRDAGPVYFEVGCMVLVLVTLGRWLEANGKLQATTALDALQKLLPERVQVVRGESRLEIARDELRAGDAVRVGAGQRLPCDGVVRHHAAAVDEQILTGESGPCIKEPGDPVHGGTLNLESDLEFEAVGGASALDRIIDLVRQARLAKGHYERLADRVTGWFLPLVVFIAVTAALYHGVESGLEHGIQTGLSVLLIACPCALGIATPLAVWAALGQAARRQVLFQNSQALERLADVKAVCFDKTGTLTTGAPTVVRVIVTEGDRETVLRRAGLMTAMSRHPLALAMSRCTGSPQNRAGLPAVRTLPGRGLEAVIDGEPCFLGSRRLMDDLGLDAGLAEGQSDPSPLACIGWGGRVRGVFAFQEELRGGAAACVSDLGRQGLHVEVLTGDHRLAGNWLAQELGVSVLTGLLPEDKVRILESLREQRGCVAMVGDGINDAPVLAAADVGIALGCGADVARDSASICLMGNDLELLPWSVDLARRAVRVIRQNLFWAFAYNIVGIGAACTGRLNPVIAALAMVASSAFVLANSLRLK